MAIEAKAIKKETVKKKPTAKPVESAAREVGKNPPPQTASGQVVVSAVSKNVLSSPYKLRLVANMVRGKQSEKAVDILSLTNKKAAAILLKAVKSCLANAENNHNLDPKTLYVSRLMINEGMKLPRYRIASRGRVTSVTRRRSSILIEMTAKK